MVELYRPAFIHGYDIEITQGQDFTWGFRLIATDIDGSTYLLDTEGYTAAFTVRAPDASGTAQIEVDTVSGEVVVGSSPAGIERNTAYIVGQWGTDGSAVYECTVAGTTDASPVLFDDTINHTTTDGTVTWNCIGDDSTVCNLTIILPSAITEALTAWGRGVYSIEVKDTYDHTVFYADGAAWLREESTW